MYFKRLQFLKILPSTALNMQFLFTYFEATSKSNWVNKPWQTISEFSITTAKTAKMVRKQLPSVLRNNWFLQTLHLLMKKWRNSVVLNLHNSSRSKGDGADEKKLSKNPFGLGCGISHSVKRQPWSSKNISLNEKLKILL